MNFTTSEENYVKAIFHLQSEDGNVTTSELAERLNTKPASVTDMMKKLKIRKLVHYQRYKGFRLSREGKKVALGIVRRHRLWEFFLSEKLKFNWDEVHEVAEHLEHVSSKKLIDKLDEYLDFPKFDPHGDPIPDTHGNMESVGQISLTDWPLNTTAIVCQVMDQSPELLDLLKSRKINIGSTLEVKRKFPFDNSLEIKTTPNSIFNISEQLANNILVRK